MTNKTSGLGFTLRMMATFGISGGLRVACHKGWADAPLAPARPASAQEQAQLGEQSSPDHSEVAEWVGQHYSVNYDACSDDEKAEWQNRYAEMHEEEAPGFRP